MPEVIVFPDAAAAVIDGLEAELAARSNMTPVRSRVPDPRPVTFVRVQRVGGPRRNLVVDDATVVVEAWAADEATGHDLAQLCRGIVHSLAGSTVGDTVVYRVDEFAGPGLLPDPVSQQTRWTMTFQISTRGRAA